MKITFDAGSHGEIGRDWPNIPRKGESVCLTTPGGYVWGIVREVLWGDHVRENNGAWIAIENKPCVDIVLGGVRLKK